jgi:transposase-like protein
MSRTKKQYSDEFKEQALAKVYSRGNRTIQAIADELNLSIHTLKTWMSHTPSTDHRPAQSAPAQRPQDWRPEQRLQALQESHGLSGEALNAWCREHGLFAHQLAQWKTEFCTATRSGSSREESQNLRSLKAENQRLERELRRKEKALAEAAALLVLQKKFQALLGGEVE